MPTLQPIVFSQKAATGETFSFEAKVSVDGDGVFAIAIPRELEEVARSLIERGDEALKGVCVKWHRNVCRVEARELRLAKAAVAETVKAHLACEVTEEHVLAYRYTSGVHYWKTEAGEIHPHGGGGRDGGWRGAKEMGAHDFRSSYSLHFAAFALVRTTYVRGDKTTVEYTRWRAANHQDESDVRARLNSFVRLSLPDGKLSNYTIIPYTPEAANFLFRTMLSLCRMDDELSAFFGDQTRVAEAIRSGNVPLLPASG